MSTDISDRFGITRLILLKSAGYERCILPMDAPLSLCASNNSGKTSLINTLQFAMIADFKLMKFDDWADDQTRRFYFPTSSSYIILEIRNAFGYHVLVMAGEGKANGFSHYYFAYKGNFDMPDFVENNKRIQSNKLFSHMMKRGKEPIKLEPRELTSLIYGGDSKFSRKLNLTLVPLRQSGDNRVFKQLYRNVLNMSQIQASDVKQFILSVFRKSMSNADLDFKQIWETAFSQVNKAQKRFDAINNNQALFVELKEKIEERKQIRGEILRKAPILDAALSDWHAYSLGAESHINSESRMIQQKINEVVEEEKLTSNNINILKGDDRELDDWFKKYEQLSNDYAIADPAAMESKKRETENALANITAQLANNEKYNETEIQELYSQARNRANKLEKKLENIESNLFSHGLKVLDRDEMASISKLFNADLLSLELGKEAFIKDDSQLEEFLRATAGGFEGNKFESDFIKLDLKSLDTTDIDIADKATLQEQLALVKKETDALKIRLETAQNVSAKRSEKEMLRIKLKKYEDELEEYADFKSRESILPKKQKLRKGVEAQLRKLSEEEQALKGKREELTEELNQLSEKRQAFRRDKEEIQRLDQQKVNLPQLHQELEHCPYLDDVQCSRETVCQFYQQYITRAAHLKSLDKDIESIYLKLLRAGISDYDHFENNDVKYSKILELFDNLDNEKSTIQKKANVAITEVASSINNLWDDFHRLKNEMAKFNRDIGKRRISNLQEFKINIIDRPETTDAVEKIISAYHQASSGETLNLLRQSSSDKSVIGVDELDRARDHLIRYADQEGSLKVEHLFDIEFNVTEKDGTKRKFTKINQAGSHATRNVAKFLSGILFLKHLIDDRSSDEYRLPIYLDEAGTVDPDNRVSLIETAHELGFCPVFASVDPLLECRYIINVEPTGVGDTIVDEVNWVISKRIAAISEPA